MRIRTLIVVLVVGASALVAGDAHAEGVTIVVNSTEDFSDTNPGNGECFYNFEIGTGRVLCSLRAAIQEANGNGNPSDVDRIRFKIPGKGPHTIDVNIDYPDITEPVLIDGYSEPGARPNTSTKGMNAKLPIRLQTGNTVLAFKVVASDSLIRGLRLSGF